MKNVDKIARQGRFEVADNGFTQGVIQRMASLPERSSIIAPRVSAWREFCLPAIGVSAAILVFGLIVTRIVDFEGGWSEKYIEKTEIFADKITARIITPPPIYDTDK